MDRDEVEEVPCVRCDHAARCERRSEEETWIYSKQIALCIEAGAPAYRPDDYFINHAIAEGEVEDDNVSNG
jgi:hypothetical protein